MSTVEIKEYYRSTENRPIRDDLRLAVSLVDTEKVAIDCGCGAGSDIDFLRKNSFTVYAFDIEEESIDRCGERFADDSDVILSKNSFSRFVYPCASLVVADASLFFCPAAEFGRVWENITQCLVPGSGIFCGSFLGPNDTMAGPDYDKEAFWPDVLVFTETELRKTFTGYGMLKWTEHKVSGKSSQGEPHNWHIFSVVARKI